MTKTKYLYSTSVSFFIRRFTLFSCFWASKIVELWYYKITENYGTIQRLEIYFKRSLVPISFRWNIFFIIFLV